MIIKLAVLNAQTQSFVKKNIRLVRRESRIIEGTPGRVIRHVDSDLISYLHKGFVTCTIYDVRPYSVRASR